MKETDEVIEMSKKRPQFFFSEVLSQENRKKSLQK